MEEQKVSGGSRLKKILSFNVPSWVWIVGLIILIIFDYILAMNSSESDGKSALLLNLIFTAILVIPFLLAYFLGRLKSGKQELAFILVLIIASLLLLYFLSPKLEVFI